MSYTPPDGDAADFSWVGALAYTPPDGDAADFSWVPTEITGTGAGVLSITGAAVGFHGGTVEGTGDATLSFSGEATGKHGAGGPAAGAFSFTAAAIGKHGVTGVAAGSVSFASAAVANHPRYELRGDVKIGDVLVNRRVRVYDRASGALVGQEDTVAGHFNVHTGFAEGEYYVTPIDLDPDAVDWKPPTANRVLSVLADDTA